jgi:hypothetical protein
MIFARGAARLEDERRAGRWRLAADDVLMQDDQAPVQ